MLRPRLCLVSISLLTAGCFESGVTVPEDTETDTDTDTSTSTSTGVMTTAPTTTMVTPADSTGTDTTTGTTTVDPDSSSSSGPGTPATAADDEFFWVQGPESLDVDAAQGLLVNDMPNEGILLVTADVQSARGGTIATEPGGGFTYEAPAGFWGVDAFSYTIEDDEGNQSDGAVTIHVRPILAPVSDFPTHEAGFTILGKTAAELPLNVDGLLGGDLRSVGDWDGDGIEDLGVVANQTRLYAEGSSGSDNEGPVYIVLGGDYSGDHDPSDLDNNQGGFAIQGAVTSNQDPATVVGGDFNGDAMRDLAITAPFANLSGRASSSTVTRRRPRSVSPPGISTTTASASTRSLDSSPVSGT